MLRQITRVSPILLGKSKNCKINATRALKWRFSPWDNFKKLRQRTKRDVRDVKKIFVNMERKIKGMEREVAKMREMTPRASDTIQRPLLPMKQETVVNESGAKTLRVQLDMPDFLPEEIKVTVLDGIVTVKAKRMEREGGVKSYQEFMREFALPVDVADESVKYTIDKNGSLVFEVLLPDGRGRND